MRHIVITVRHMRQSGVGWLSVGVLSVLALAACSGPAFDPTGSYTGTASGSGGSTTLTATITSGSSSGSWSWTLVAASSTTYTGTCTHDTGVSANNLTCTFTDGTINGSFVGNLQGNTWSGTYSDDSPESGSFTLTRP